MKVENVVEGKDGYSTITLELSEDEVAMLLESAIVEALKEYVYKHEQDTTTPDKSDLSGNSFNV